MSPERRERLLEDWKETVKGIRGGKRVGTSVYLHQSALDDQTEAYEAARIASLLAHASGHHFDLVKFSVLSPVVSLLSYPRFFEDAFPALEFAWTVDLTTEKVTMRDYSKYANKPILHRKELFLAKDHPRRAEFAAMTKKVEDLGLFYGMNAMGSEKPWGERLRKAGVTVSGNRITVKR